MPTQPTILVKKADGTTVRMSLDEVKKMKENTVKPTEFKSVPLIIRDEEDKKDNKIKDTKIEGTNVEKNILEDKAKEMLKTPELEPAPVEQLLPSNFSEKHLLHEEVASHEVKNSAVIGGVSYDDQIKKILSVARLSPPAELASRYQSLLTSYLKGIRTAEQVLEYARLPVDRGGLGLDDAGAARLGSALGRDATISNPKKTMMKPEMPPTSMTKPLPRSVSPLPSPSAMSPTTMRDIQAPSSTRAQSTPVMGPVDEMKNFSLRDWRRLALTPDKSKEIILNKFKSWKEESFFLYQDTRLAWFNSPLFRMYQEAVAKAINNAGRLADLTLSGGAKDVLTTTDITALIEVNRSLGV